MNKLLIKKEHLIYYARRKPLVVDCWLVVACTTIFPTKQTEYHDHEVYYFVTYFTRLGIAALSTPACIRQGLRQSIKVLKMEGGGGGGVEKGPHDASHGQ